MVAVGVFIVLTGVGTLVGMPWRYSSGGIAIAVLQIVGAASALGIGAGIAWLGLDDARQKQ
ncbi:hypothetical protein C440_17136 [Haloferax mucosum ATCC BAA-1512]|uniref:DUF8123 domain-containing protein n=1 Tax=Haloferax mucosum ATCC BAA-1512 TaxID=662479 RepID=M0I004_9EURY|nr:hypothetical protein C440_17136 [Haloferax mucosum ATCC BAA-1512]